MHIDVDKDADLPICRFLHFVKNCCLDCRFLRYGHCILVKLNSTNTAF